MKDRPQSHGMLLVVEDDYLIATALVDDLMAVGFDVHCCAHGTDAIAHLENHYEIIATLITDIQLGDGPSGWDLANHARMLNPELPVIYVTGDSAHLWSQQGVPHSVMMQKPYLGREVVAALCKMLDIDERHGGSTL